MKYIKKYKLFEGVGDSLDKNDKNLLLLKDLSLELKDLDMEVEVKGYESYTSGYNTYDLFIESNDKFSIYDINKDNVSKLQDMNKRLEKLNKLNDECLNLITRAIDNELYLCEYEISAKFSSIWIHIRFTTRQDGEPVGSDYKYYDEDEENY